MADLTTLLAKFLEDLYAGSITVTGVVKVGDGTEAAPSYSFASDPNTGVFSPAANVVGISANGQERMRVLAGETNLYSAQVLGWTSGVASAAVDVALSRGAANRLDLASGDSLYLVGGGIGLGAANGTNGSLYATSSILSASPTAGIGYATGAGGSVTQGSGSGKATGVTLDKVTGTITMDAANLGAGAIVSFLLTNAAIALTDFLLIQHVSGGTGGIYTAMASTAAGSATVFVRNNSASPEAVAIVLRFVVIKAVTA